MTSDTSIKYYFFKIFHSLETFILPIVAFFAPVQGILLTVGAFILADTFWGIWKARKQGQKITSKGLSAIISKMLLYEAAVLLSFCLDVFILGDILHGIFGVEQLIVKVTSMVLVYIELKSINENYHAVKGVDLWKEFKRLLSRTKELKDEITNITNGNNN